MTDRRAFLRLLTASPLFVGIPHVGQAMAQTTALQDVDNLIGTVGDARDIFDLEAVAQRNTPPAHWGYLAGGEEMPGANRTACSRLHLRTQMLVGPGKPDMSVDLFGATYRSPIFLCPLGAQKAFNPEGEIASARAAATRGQLQVLSTTSSASVEDVVAARGAPVWYQIYPTSNWEIGFRSVKRAEAAGCTVVAVTVDLPAGRNVESATRLARMSSLTWDFVRRLKGATKMKVVVKGLVSRADAGVAVGLGADGVIVSAHGGRATEAGRGTLEALPDVVAAVRGRIPVLVDGGVRRGSDVFKALTLGATAVGIGRPYVWGLGAFGQSGVERVLDILNQELRLAMAGGGVRSLRKIATASPLRQA